jgi:hypothetical protein
MAKNRTKAGKTAYNVAVKFPEKLGDTLGSVLTAGMLFGVKPKKKK